MSDNHERNGYHFVNEVHTCNHYQSIILEEGDLKIKSGGYSTILLPHTKSEVRRAMRDGCPLFVELDNARREAWSFRGQWAMVLTFFGLLTIWREDGGVEEFKRRLRSVARQILQHQYYALEFSPSSYSALNCACYYLWIEGSFGGRAWLENSKYYARLSLCYWKLKKIKSILTLASVHQKPLILLVNGHESVIHLIRCVASSLLVSHQQG